MITFFSNFISEHQIPFCDAMYRLTDGAFRFVAAEPMAQERKELGFVDRSDSYPYVIRAYASDEAYRAAMRLGAESDVVIIGSAPEGFIEQRLKENKLTFRYSERLFKKFRWRFHPHAWRVRWERDTRYRKKNLHMLCASAYTAPDCRSVFAYPHKTYKWGYFPAITQKPYHELAAMKSNGDQVSLLWVSRFIPLKHPEEIVKLCKRLKQDGYRFRIEMIGVGELRGQYEAMIKSEDLADRIAIIGPLTPEEVLERMQRADVFLFTSDKREGWGAVMNEAMSSACATVACREIGSVPFLVEHGENGLIYDKRGGNSLYRNVKRLLDDKALRGELQKNAYDTVKGVWNADTAAERLLHLIDCIQKGEETGYTSGPCSRA